MSFLIEIMMVIHTILTTIFLEGANRVVVLEVFLIGIVWLFTIEELEKVLKEVPERQRVGTLLVVIFAVIMAILIFAISGYVMSI